MFTTIKSATTIGIDAALIDVEINIGRGINFLMVGLPLYYTHVRTSPERVVKPEPLIKRAA